MYSYEQRMAAVILYGYSRKRNCNIRFSDLPNRIMSDSESSYLLKTIASEPFGTSFSHECNYEQEYLQEYEQLPKYLPIYLPNLFIDIMWVWCYIVYIVIPTYIHLPLQEYNYLPIQEAIYLPIYEDNYEYEYT